MSKFGIVALLICGLGLCGFEKTFASSQKLTAAQIRPIAESYRTLVQKAYSETLETNQQLHAEAEKFTATSSEEQLLKVREAWKKARLAYSRTEAFRFYGGPIDQAETGLEPLMNAWPIDESYLDGVVGRPDSGLIQNPKDYPVLDAKTLIAANEKDGERNVSTGYHAVEFLLWGQDLSPDKPGQRKATEFTGPVGKRRGQMLTALTGLLVSQSQALTAAWDLNAPYVRSFLSEKPDEIMRRILVALTSLSADEMAGERMAVALEKNDPENEQDCFSDFSLEDMKANESGIMNVFNQTGLMGLFQKTNAKAATVLKNRMQAAKKKIASIPAPFDKILLNPKSKDRAKVQMAIRSLQEQARDINHFAKIWGIELNVQDE